jgi:hypothetical protein
MKAREDELRVVYPETRVSDGGDAVDDVQDTRNHQQDADKQCATNSSHVLPQCSVAPYDACHEV